MEQQSQSPRARALLSELGRRNQFPRAVRRYADELFDKQRNVFDYRGRFVALHAGRRSGKTHLGRVRCIVAAAAHPGSFIPIFERTSTCAAARVMWTGLKQDSAAYGLGLEFTETLKIATCPNGAQIGLIGVDKLDETEKTRGDKHPFALIDEAGSFRPHVLHTLIREAVRPALADMRGSLWQLGTPNPTCSGPFHDACESEDSPYKVFHWDMRDNPHIPEPAVEMAAVREEYGWSEHDPTYQREWLGKWAFSADSQVYAYDPEVNHCDELPEEFDHYCIGIDFGFVDSTAVVVLGFHEYDRHIWVVESYKQPKLLTSDAAKLVEKYVERYEPIAIVGDAGGLGKPYVEEMRQRYAIPIKAAEKTRKHAFIELMNSDLRTGRLLIEPKKNQELLTELKLLQWDHNSRRHSANYKRWKISESCDDHLADALLYGWRESKHWIPGEKPAPVPEPGEDGFEDHLERKMEAAFRRSQTPEHAWQDLEQDEERQYTHREEADPFLEADDWLEEFR